MQRPAPKVAMTTSDRGFHFRLCRLQFPNCTVAEMLERLSSVELGEWAVWQAMQDEADKKAAAAAKR